VITYLKQRIKLFSSPRKEFYLFLKSLTGFYPVKLRLYDIAFIHKSVPVVDSHGFAVNNERLEYLGDAILGAVIADYLYNRFPHKDEGFLTQLRARIVNRSFLTQLALRTDLARFMESNTNFPSETSHIYGDVFEALIGAIYLDKGYEITKNFILKKIVVKYVDIKELETLDTNFKSRLIEWGQKGKTKIEFATKEKSNPQGNSLPFLSEVFIDDVLMGKGEGSSKKEAQQKASEEALKKLPEA
jgi:ribonuclease-3